jgi:hypothetical protein
VVKKNLWSTMMHPARTRWHLMLPLALLVSCKNTPSLPELTPEERLTIIGDNEAYRAEHDSFMRHHPESPFHRDPAIHYGGTQWFPVDPLFRATSILHRYETPDTVTVFGTRGEARRQLKYGYFEFILPDEQGNPRQVRLNVYKFTPYDSVRYALYRDELNVWFTDETTGKETYDVGRYVNIGTEHPDPDYLYTIDLNMAYNPYCAYSDSFSCAIPREEDHIALPLRVGEKKYHP